MCRQDGARQSKFPLNRIRSRFAGSDFGETALSRFSKRVVGEERTFRNSDDFVRSPAATFMILKSR